MTLEAKKRKKVKAEWYTEFREKQRKALDGRKDKPDDWESTTAVWRETAKKISGVSSGKDVQQVRLIKDRDGNVFMSKERVIRRFKEYF